MDIKIEQAQLCDSERVLKFYSDFLDNLDLLEFSPGWIKGVYPSEEYLKKSVENGQVYIGVKDGKIISAMILNNFQNGGYEKLPWKGKADGDEVMVIHTLAVSPNLVHKGIGKLMIKKALEVAKEQRKKSVRLDVLQKNVPAVRLYSSMGFTFVGEQELFYENTGWHTFLLYEYIPEI